MFFLYTVFHFAVFPVAWFPLYIFYSVLIYQGMSSLDERLIFLLIRRCWDQNPDFLFYFSLEYVVFDFGTLWGKFNMDEFQPCNCRLSFFLQFLSFPFLKTTKWFALSFCWKANFFCKPQKTCVKFFFHFFWERRRFSVETSSLGV